MDEFNSLVDEEYHEWVAQYLVMKRASIEPNFHFLYMSFMDAVNKPGLRKGVLRETYRNIKVLILYFKWHYCSLSLKII